MDSQTLRILNLEREVFRLLKILDSLDQQVARGRTLLSTIGTNAGSPPPVSMPPVPPTGDGSGNPPTPPTDGGNNLPPGTQPPQSCCDKALSLSAASRTLVDSVWGSVSLSLAPSTPGLRKQSLSGTNVLNASVSINYFIQCNDSDPNSSYWSLTITRLRTDISPKEIISTDTATTQVTPGCASGSLTFTLNAKGYGAWPNGGTITVN